MGAEWEGSQCDESSGRRFVSFGDEDEEGCGLGKCQELRDAMVAMRKERNRAGWRVPHDGSTSSDSRWPILGPCHVGRTARLFSIIRGVSETVQL